MKIFLPMQSQSLTQITLPETTKEADSTSRSILAHLTTVPIRHEPDDRSEMVNSMLLGETARIISQIDDMWLEIETDFDHYRGFVSALMVIPTPEFWQEPFFRFTPLSHHFTRTDGTKKMLSMGSRIKLDADLAILFPDGQKYFFSTDGIQKNHFIHELPNPTLIQQDVVNPNVVNPDALKKYREECIPFAEHLLGTPYLWGGRSSIGVDCSGLTQTSSMMCGVYLPRDARQQAKCGIDIEPNVDALLSGDLLFFSNNPEGKITHVALYLGQGEYIHASGQVRKNSLLPEKMNFSAKHREQFISAKRILPFDK
jgi:hypothetical protein